MDHMTAKGHVDTFLVSPEGVRTRVDSDHNTLTYMCADAVARMFAGISGSRPVKVGFVIGDAGNGTAFHFDDTAADTVKRAKTQADIVVASEGKLEVKNSDIDPNPQFSASDTAKYSGNVVTLGAMSAVDASNDKQVYGLLLKDADDNVLAIKKLADGGVKRPKGYAMAISWSVTFQ